MKTALIIRILAAVASFVILGVLCDMSAADSAPDQKRARDDVEKIGHRDIDGIDGFNWIPRKAERELGRRFAEHYWGKKEIVSDSLVVEYVDQIGQNIGFYSDWDGPLVIKVIRDEVINAAALPGGYFVVNTGLIQSAGSEAELAGVMGHEIAHIAGRHGTRKLSRHIQTQIAVNAVIGGLGSKLRMSRWKAFLAGRAIGMGLTMAGLKFSRTFERKADALGVQYLYAAGYDPQGMVDFFERLAAREKSRLPQVSALFRTHPMSAKRVKLVQKRIDETLPVKHDYRVSGSEFSAVQDRLRELYGDLPERGSRKKSRKRAKGKRD